MSSPQSVPEGRYGRPRRQSRVRLPKWALGALAVAFGVVLAFLAYQNLGDEPITAQRIGFDERPGNRMEITIDVRKDDESKPVVCIVRVRDKTGAESGRKEVLVPANNNGRPLRTVITSGTRPVTADIFGCSYSVPEYLSNAVRPSG